MSRRITSGARRVTNIVLGVITTILLVAALTVLFVIPGPQSWTDAVAATDDAIDQSVSPTQSELYCPAPMGLADTGTYGDSAFQSSVGNLSTQARYATFGSVYTSMVSAFGGSASTSDVTLKDHDLTDDADVKTGAQQVNDSALMDTRMLQAAEGTGSTGTIASWADDGDLKGVSAASCIPTSLSQSFLLTGSTTGTTQQLIVANPSTKPTSVDLAIWGSHQSGKLALSTQSALTVPAGGEASLDLSAAVSDQDGLYVTVSSKETPIAAVVRTVAMDGLTSKGSDFALPLSGMSNASVSPSVEAGDEVTAYLYTHADTATELSWITSHGLVQAEKATLTAGQVSVVDLGKAPDGALGVMSTAEDKLAMSIRTVRAGDGQQTDFALVNAAAPVRRSGVVVPDGVTATLTVANTSSTEQTVTVQAYNADGDALNSKDITIGANSAERIAAKDFNKDGSSATIFMMTDDSHKVAWNARLTRDGLGDGKIAGISSVESVSLMPMTSHVWARSNAGIVR